MCEQKVFLMSTVQLFVFYGELMRSDYCLLVCRLFETDHSSMTVCFLPGNYCFHLD